MISKKVPIKISLTFKKGRIKMPLIRKAIEKRRRHFITLLMNTGLFKQLDLESLTLTELELEYKRYSERRNEEYE